MIQTTSHSENTKELIGFYHQINKKRQDTWAKVRKYTSHLSTFSTERIGYNRLRKAVNLSLVTLESIEDYTGYPSKEDFRYLWVLFNQNDFITLERAISRISRALRNDSYRRRDIPLIQTSTDIVYVDEDEDGIQNLQGAKASRARPYFELLVVDDMPLEDENTLMSSFKAMRHHEDQFIYRTIVVSSFEDAIIAILINPNIQACVLRPDFPVSSKRNPGMITDALAATSERFHKYVFDGTNQGIELGRFIKSLRPELDLYLVSDMATESITNKDTQYFNRIFYNENPGLDQHHNILRGIAARYETPFFSALKEYSRKPTGIFHAMPISRAKSIEKSHWIGDMLDFYGLNIFLAETSSTSGGLDSLLQPTGPLKKAQEYAARAFGSRRSYFVTNGTSTANKIVVQALVQPGDIILVDRDCHKSHHYGMVLSGAHVYYLDSYPINDLSIYGGVPLKEIKRTLLKYRDLGQLHRVKMLLLTNCTFDGVVYNVRRVMEECLAIKPDLVFLWDEAWFAFASFNPIYRRRTGMHVARTLRKHYKSSSYRQEYKKYQSKLAKVPPGKLTDWMLENSILPDPDQVRLRVYTTHSTHKTLTALRQGSMIHVYDQDFRQKSEMAFNEAYMTHTSTSPNYQILASLDIGRRQVELEGYELVNKQLELAMTFRQSAGQSDRLKKYFKVLVNKDLVPSEYRESGVDSYFSSGTGFSRMEEAWDHDEFVIDPTRITVHIGKSGIDGNTFKNQYLMDKHGIQINKTSRNTVLFMINIGTTRSSIAYLLDILLKTANELEWREEEMSPMERELHRRRVVSLTKELPPLPDFSYFHDTFRPGKSLGTPEGDIRRAYFLAYDYDNCEYLSLDNGELEAQISAGRQCVSTSFIIPYPPGFPILVPGQVISKEILHYMKALDVKEIHGYNPELGMSVFKESSLTELRINDEPVVDNKSKAANSQPKKETK